MDPDFLALSDRQRRSIDRAFRKLAVGPDGKRKGRRTGKSKPQIEDEIYGGEGGGFMDDEEGGFLPEEEDGGFIPDDSESAGPSRPPKEDGEMLRIPLSALPRILAGLGLPTDDDVLEVFRASASGWEEEAGQYRSTDASLGVELKDFRAVCAALMSPDEGGAVDDPNTEETSEEDDDAEDTYENTEESSLSSASGSEYGGSKAKRKPSTRVNKDGESTSKTKRRRKAGLEETGPRRLNSRQREMAREVWGMVKDNAGLQSRKGQRSDLLGREEVKVIARSLGEMWSEDEISEMVALFSKQHEGRGLSFDDFGIVLLRAGLV